MANHSDGWWSAQRDLEDAKRSAERHPDSATAARELKDAERKFEQAERDR